MTVCIEYVNTEIRCKEKSMVLEQKNFNLLIIRWRKPEKKDQNILYSYAMNAYIIYEYIMFFLINSNAIRAQKFSYNFQPEFS